MVKLDYKWMKIALKIKYLIENQDIAKEMGRMAQLKVKKEFTIEKYGNYLIDLY